MMKKLSSVSVLFGVAATMGPSLLWTSHLVSAMTASPEPFTETQPNGQVIELIMNGDMFGSWMSDTDGYTVIRDPSTGQYVYAEDDGDGDLMPSKEAVVKKRHRHRSDPSSMDGGIEEEEDDGPGFITKKIIKRASSNKKKGLRPIKRDCQNLLCADRNEDDDDHDDNPSNSNGNSNSNNYLRGFVDADQLPKPSQSIHRNLTSGTTRTLRNLVIPIRWSDHWNRTLPTKKEIAIVMNNAGPHPLCPTGSVRDVMLENSYGALSIQSVVTDWVPMPNTEFYYANNVSGLSTRTFSAIKFALDYVHSRRLVNFSYFDVNRDGQIDAITFLHSGYAAETGGTDSSNVTHNNRIWSHKWRLNKDTAFTSRDGVKVTNYHISPALWGRSGAAIGRIGVIAHEMGHFLGLPDLYDTNGGGKGIGTYGLMGNSWGWDASQQYPPHMSGWSKYFLGWVDAVAPKEGINQIEASEVQSPTQPQLYKITDGFPDGEFLLIENRQRLGFDAQIPQGGLVVWHVDYTASLGGYPFLDSLNNEGHPWQVGWPRNGKHYGVALLQADGLYELDRGGDVGNLGDRDDVFHAMGPTDQLVPCINPGECQHPNTDSYQGGVITRTNVYITDISTSGRIMSFQYRNRPPSSSPSLEPSSSPSLVPSEVPSQVPTSMPSVSPTVVENVCLALGGVCEFATDCCSGFCDRKLRRSRGRCIKL